MSDDIRYEVNRVLREIEEIKRSLRIIDNKLDSINGDISMLSDIQDDLSIIKNKLDQMEIGR